MAGQSSAMFGWRWTHRALTSPGYVTQPRILLLAPDTQITPALTALELL